MCNNLELRLLNLRSSCSVSWAQCPFFLFITQGPHTWQGLLSSLFDRQQNLDMRWRILICSDPSFSGWVACGGGWMETLELIKTVQTNVVANYIITQPVNLHARQKHGELNVRLHQSQCIQQMLVFLMCLVLCFIPVFSFWCFFPLCMSALC